LGVTALGQVMNNVVSAITEHGNARDFAGLKLPDSFKIKKILNYKKY
jgi:hypothetical protein